MVCASANPLLLDGLRHLEALGPFRVSGEAREVRGLVASLANCKPALLILDLDLTGQDSSLVEKCRRAHPGLKVVVVEGRQVDPTLSPEVEMADAFVDLGQSMARLVTQLEKLCSL